MAIEAADDRLVQEAVRIGRHETTADAVDAAMRQFGGGSETAPDASDPDAINEALRKYIRHRQQVEDAIALFGTIDYDPDYDYKALRRSKRCP